MLSREEHEAGLVYFVIFRVSSFHFLPSLFLPVNDLMYQH